MHRCAGLYSTNKILSSKPLFPTNSYVISKINTVKPTITMHRGAAIKLHFIKKLNFQKKSLFMHSLLKMKFIPKCKQHQI